MLFLGAFDDERINNATLKFVSEANDYLKTHKQVAPLALRKYHRLVGGYLLKEVKPFMPAECEQTAGFFIYSLTGIPFPARYFFSSGMVISPKWNSEAASTASAFPFVKAS